MLKSNQNSVPLLLFYTYPNPLPEGVSIFFFYIVTTVQWVLFKVKGYQSLLKNFIFLVTDTLMCNQVPSHETKGSLVSRMISLSPCLLNDLTSTRYSQN